MSDKQDQANLAVVSAILAFALHDICGVGIGRALRCIIREQFIFRQSPQSRLKECFPPAGNLRQPREKVCHFLGGDRIYARKKLVLRPGVKQIAAVLGCVKPVESNREDGFGRLLSPNCRQILDEAEIPGDGVIDRELGRLPRVESAGDSYRFIDGKHTLRQKFFLAAAIEILPVLLVAVVPVVNDIPDVLSLFLTPAFFLAPEFSTLSGAGIFALSDMIESSLATYVYYIINIRSAQEKTQEFQGFFRKTWVPTAGSGKI